MSDYLKTRERERKLEKIRGKSRNGNGSGNGNSRGRAQGAFDFDAPRPTSKGTGEIERAFQEWLKRLRAQLKKSGIADPVGYGYTMGPKYWRVYQQHVAGSRSALHFFDPKTGDIYGAASWKKRRPGGARANVLKLGKGTAKATTPATPKKAAPAAAMVKVPVMAGGGKPTMLELKVLGHAQREDRAVHGVLLAPSRVSDDLFADERTAAHDQKVRMAMLRLKGAGYLARIKQPKGHEPRYKLAMPKVKKAKNPGAAARPGGFPPLKMFTGYHFGKAANERGLVRRDNDGYNALTPTQSKIFKTQKGAMEWLEERIGADRMAEASLDTPDDSRLKKIKRGTT